MSNHEIDSKLIFSENLARARKRLGMSQEKLADDVDLSRQAIFKYEKGEISPSMDVIFKLSTVLKVPVNYFFEASSDEKEFSKWLDIIDFTPATLTEVNYREKKHLDQLTDGSVKETTYRELIKLLAIEQITHKKIEFKNPVQNLTIGSREDAEKAALEVRKKWQLNQHPIANVIDLLENKGIRVFEVKTSETFQGLSAKYGEVPIIVLNFSIQEVARKRFTALHELGHLILQLRDGLDYDTIEKICDAFAATMLLPKQLLIMELGQDRKTLSKSELIRIKEKYGISVRAVLVGSQIARIISWNEYEKLTKEIDNVGYSTKFGILEKPTRLEQLMDYAKTEGLADERKLKSILKGEIPKDLGQNLLTQML